MPPHPRKTPEGLWYFFAYFFFIIINETSETDIERNKNFAVSAQAGKASKSFGRHRLRYSGTVVARVYPAAFSGGQ